MSGGFSDVAPIYRHPFPRPLPLHLTTNIGTVAQNILLNASPNCLQVLRTCLYSTVCGTIGGGWYTGRQTKRDARFSCVLAFSLRRDQARLTSLTDARERLHGLLAEAVQRGSKQLLESVDSFAEKFAASPHDHVERGPRDGNGSRRRGDGTEVRQALISGGLCEEEMVRCWRRESCAFVKPRTVLRSWALSPVWLFSPRCRLREDTETKDFGLWRAKLKLSYRVVCVGASKGFCSDGGVGDANLETPGHVVATSTEPDHVELLIRQTTLFLVSA